jgi:hypothetical protein
VVDRPAAEYLALSTTLYGRAAERAAELPPRQQGPLPSWDARLLMQNVLASWLPWVVAADRVGDNVPDRRERGSRRASGAGQ